MRLRTKSWHLLNLVVFFSCSTFARISKNWWEWHAFSVALSDHSQPKKPEFSLIVGRAGDWTTGLIGDSVAGSAPPTLYIRGVNPPGFMHMHHAYKKGMSSKVYTSIFFSDFFMLPFSRYGLYWRRNCPRPASHLTAHLEHSPHLDWKGEEQCI